VSLDDLDRGAGAAGATSSITATASVTTASSSVSAAGSTSSTSSTGTGGAMPSAYVEAVQASQPLAYYRFEDASDSLVVVDEIGGLDATWTGTRDRRTPGALTGDESYAVAFDGESYVRFPNAFEFAGLVPFTIELWFRVPQVTSLQFMLGNETGNPRRGYTIVTFSDANVGLERWGVEPGGDNVTAGAVMESGSIAPDTWYHFVATWDGQQHAAYLDGVPGNSFAPPDPLVLPDNGDPAILGASGDTFTRYVGDVDELAIYDRALGAAEVLAHRAAAGPVD
jgi:hypothetical protein